MTVIGIDFGTTNSTISYYDKKTREPKPFTAVIGGDTDYIPTVVAYDKDRKYEVSIGKSAKKNQYFNNFEAYEHFKHLLGKDADKKIEGKTKTPEQVTQDFLRELLDEYKNSQKINRLDAIVMTVPEIWTKEDSNKTARENIEEIFNKLGYGDSNNKVEFQLQSEPLAAATYFCSSYKQKHGKAYTGHIVVIDYGGGTLDVTLCEAMEERKNEREIVVLERHGCGEYDETNGCAGVAFDEAVIEKLFRDKNFHIKKGSPEFNKLRDDFEEMKILKSSETTKDLKRYYDDPAKVENKYIFPLAYEYNGKRDKFDVRCEDLNQCFEEVNAPKLRESLEKIKKLFPPNNVESEDYEHFKVLLVGGFSNFYTVEKVVKQYFNAESGDYDSRFDQPFDTRDRALAISKGAALIAAKEYSIVHHCAYTYGYVTYGSDGSGGTVPYYNTVIKKGANIKEHYDPKFLPERYEEVSDEKGKITIFWDDGQPNNAGRKVETLDESIKELFNVGDGQKWYQIDFSVTKQEIPIIHTKNKHSGKIRSTSLNKLMDKIRASR